MMGSQEVDKYDHNHCSIRWLIMRGARSTRIRVERTFRIKSGRINDKTFRGIGVVYVPNMSCCKRVASVLRNVLRRAFGFCFSLRNCSITNGADTDVSVRMHGCPHLKHIDLSGYIDNSGSIDLYNTIRSGIFETVTDIGVLVIVQGCRHLSTINLDGCWSISDISVLAITQGCHHLTSISLRMFYNISDVGISAIAQGCPDLRSIDLPNCRSISDIGVSAIAQSCPDLISINLVGCHFVSDIGVCAIARGCPDLRSIKIDNGIYVRRCYSILEKDFPYITVQVWSFI